MSGNRVATRKSRSRNKVLALGAAGLMLAAGITVPSLAAWTDIEWVTGNAGAGAGVTSSSFEVEQFASGDADWDHYETQGGANVIDFSAQAATLSPGDTVYAYVRLRTVAGSLGGDLTLGADTVVTGNALAAVLTYGARIVADDTACDLAGYTAGTALQADGSALTAAGGTFSLAAAADAVTPGVEKVVCFAIDFEDTPANQANGTLQGLTVVPVWHFDADSVATP